MYCGILILDKPAGLTSHDVVARVRRKLKTKKVGHAGTLDPDATGVLVLCAGDATRLLEYMGADEKVYAGQVVFGVATDTDDASGEVVSEADASSLRADEVLETAHQLTGHILQRPPRFSAVHVQGKRAYDLARAGAEFDLPAREVFIRELSVSEFVPGVTAKADFRVHCSKGTYIRSLCRDWGALMGLPAHMSTLRRVQSGSYRIEEAAALEAFEAAEEPGVYLRPMQEAVRHMQKAEVSVSQAKRLSQGQGITLAAHGLDEGPVAVVCQHEIVAVAAASRQRLDSDVVIRPRKVFWREGQQ